MKKIGLGLLTLIAKFAPKLLSVLIKVLKGAKFTKVALMGASVIAYSYMFTWQFAVAILVSLFIHEYGHVWAMKRMGMKVKGIYFIPFIGAAAVTEDEFKSRYSELYVALMGPIWGFATTLFCVAIYLIFSWPLFGAIAGWVALVNLFNLLPVSPLDGGRVFKSFIFSLNSRAGIIYMIIGILFAVFIAFTAKLFLFGLLAIIGGLDLFYEWYRLHKKKIEIDKLKIRQFIFGITTYLILIGALWFTMSQLMHIPEVKLAMEVLMK